MATHTGKIKKVVLERGFGFIDARDGREIFFHHQGLIGVKFDELKSDQPVEFEVEKSLKGPKAFNIRLMPQTQETEQY